MEYTQGYGTVIIKFDQKGNPYLTGEKGKDPIKQILPDALEYVTLYAREDMWLRDVCGVDIIIYPNMSQKALIEEFKARRVVLNEAEKRMQSKQ